MAPGLQKYLKSVGGDVEFGVLRETYLTGKLVGLNKRAALHFHAASAY
jgi:hypothetical protein